MDAETHEESPSPGNVQLIVLQHLRTGSKSLGGGVVVVVGGQEHTKGTLENVNALGVVEVSG